jgi:hypothetical protein
MAKAQILALCALPLLLSSHAIGQSMKGSMQNAAMVQGKDVRGTPEAPLVIRSLPSEKTLNEIQEKKLKSDRETYLFYVNLLAISCTIALVIANIKMIYYYKMQTNLMKEELIENKKAANAATAAANAANQTGRLMLRMEQPLIAIEQMDYQSKSQICYIKLGNHGRTPAFFKSFIIDYMTSNFPSDEPSYNTANIQPITKQGVTNHGDVIDINTSLGVSLGDWVRILKGEYKIWIYGYAEYEDFMNGLIRYKFCRVFTPILGNMYHDTTPSSGEWNDDGPLAYRGTEQRS